MDKLWSPWRSQYLDSFKSSKDDDKCVFCSAESKEVTDENNLIVYKDKHTYIILNLYPYNAGHLMVVPYRHTSDLTSFTAEENMEIMKNVQLSVKALGMVMGPQGFNMGANLGKAAGAGIDAHIHFHIVPRWTGDINFMPAIGEVKIISQDLLDLKRKLLKAYQELSL